MPRTKVKPAVDKTKTVNKKKLDSDAKSIDKNTKRLAVVNQQFGDNLPYDYGRHVQLAKHFLHTSAAAMLEAGRHLILLKENEQHGKFQEALAEIGIASRSARKMMQASIKFSKRPTLAALGNSKMFELMIEDDDDLSELEDGGTIAELTLDDIDRMSVRELKEALRKNRKKLDQEKEIHEKQLQSKEKKINELDAALQRRESSDIDIRVDELSMHLERVATEACGFINSDLAKIMGDILTWSEAPQQLKAACVHAADRVSMQLHDLRMDFLQGVDATPDDDAWMDGANQ